MNYLFFLQHGIAHASILNLAIGSMETGMETETAQLKAKLKKAPIRQLCRNCT